MPSVQLFAYEIATNNEKTINAILRAKGVDPDEMTEEQYFHQQANLQRDLILKHVVPSIEDDVLPVFLAPEFFFKWRDGLPYGRATFFNSIEYLKKLSEAFPDVLWVVGTVWWSEPHSTGKAMVHNSALILQGGSVLHSWQKERLSQIDGLNQGPELWDRHDPAEARILQSTQDPFFDAKLPGSDDIVRCGIEICLDHLTLKGPPVSVGVLRQHYLKNEPNPAVGDGIDLHILTAAGMPLQPENVVARRGGLYARCDGGRGALRSQFLEIDRDHGVSAATALRRWTIDPTDVDSDEVGDDPDNRLAVYEVTPLS
jgi:hypothetical protein